MNNTYERSDRLKKWKQREPVIPYNENDLIIDKLAKINGIRDVERFLNPDVADTYHYSLLPNIEDAVIEIHKAISLKKKIILFCDPDADGIFSTTIAYRFISNFTDNIEIVYGQRSRGHGLNVSEELIPEETEFLLVVDSSTNDVDACKKLHEKGIPIVILDHHDWEGEDNPYAIIVNPKLPNSKYPNKEMSGALTTWKVMVALDDYLNTSYSNSLMDVAGFSILSDAMSALEPENRYYIDYALKNVMNLGLKTLIEQLKIDVNKLNSTEYLYSISPTITAITRLDKIEYALQLLLSDDVFECIDISKELIKANEERKRIQREAIELVEPQVNPDDKIIIVVEPSIGKGMNGIVAAKIAEEYQKPAIVLGHKDESSKRYDGSFRTYGNFQTKDFLGGLDNTIFAAGHATVGGVGVWKNRLVALKKEINDKLKDYVFEQTITYDLEFEVNEITEPLINQINGFYRISGKGIQPSRVLIKNAFIINKKTLGKGKDTLKAEICDESESWFVDKYDSLTPAMVALKFKMSEEHINNFPEHVTVDLLGTLNVNEYIQWKPKKKTIKNNQIFIEQCKLSN